MLEFLQQFHLQQNLPVDADVADVLEYFFPDEIVTLFDEESTEVVAEALSSRFERMKLSWSPELTEELVSTMRKRLVDFKSVWVTEAGADIPYAEPAVMSYATLDNEIRVDGIRVKYFVDTLEHVSDPAGFLGALVNRTQSETAPERRALCIRAQKLMLEKYPGEGGNYRGFATMLEMVRAFEPASATPEKEAVVDDCMRIIVLTLVGAPEIHRQASGNNIESFVLQNGFKALAEDVVRLEGLGHSKGSALLGTLDLMAQCAEIESVRAAVVAQPALIYSVTRLLRPGAMEEAPAAALAAAQLLLILARTEGAEVPLLRELGTPLCLVHVAVLSPAPANDPTVLACAEALAALIGSAHGSAPNAANASLLHAVLTNHLFMKLGSPDAFTALAREQEVLMPVFLWTEDMRKQLGTTIEGEMAKLHKSAGPRRKWAGVKALAEIKYRAVEAELVVDNVYVRLFNEQPTFVLSNMPQLVHAAVANTTKPGTPAAEVALQTALLKNVINNYHSLIPALARQLADDTMPQLLDIEDTGVRAVILDLLGQLGSCRGPASEMVVQFLPVLHTLIHQSLASTEEVEAVLRVLGEVVRVEDAAVMALRDSGMVLTLLMIFSGRMGKAWKHVRRTIAQIFGDMCAESTQAGGYMLDVLVESFVPRFRPELEKAGKDPMQFVNYFDGEWDNPDIIWNNDTRSDFWAMVNAELGPVTPDPTADPTAAAPVWDWRGLGDRYKRPTLERELQLGGVYVRCFNDDPEFPVDNEVFLEAVLAEVKAKGGTVAVAVLHALKNLLVNYTELQQDPLVRKSIPVLFDVLGSTAAGVDESGKALRLAAIEIVSLLASKAVVTDGIHTPAYAQSLFSAIYAFRADSEMLPVVLKLFNTMARLASSNGAASFSRHAHAAGAVLLLTLMLGDQKASKKVRSSAATGLIALAADRGNGFAVVEMFKALTSPEFENALSMKPSSLIAVWGTDQDVEEDNPFGWDDKNRNALHAFLAAAVATVAAGFESGPWDGHSTTYDVDSTYTVHGGKPPSADVPSEEGPEAEK